MGSCFKRVSSLNDHVYFSYCVLCLSRSSVLPQREYLTGSVVLYSTYGHLKQRLHFSRHRILNQSCNNRHKTMKVLYLHQLSKLREERSEVVMQVQYELGEFIHHVSQTQSPNVGISLKTIHVSSLYLVISFPSPLACKL